MPILPEAPVPWPDRCAAVGDYTGIAGRSAPAFARRPVQVVNAAGAGPASRRPRKGALLRGLAHDAGGLDARGAELELGNLAERIELGVGEQVGGRLDVGERDEHDAVRHRVVLAGGELDRTAAGADAHHVAR